LHLGKDVARTTKKRAKQLKHDKFRDTTLNYYDRLSHRVEGRGSTVLYAIGGVVGLIALLLVFNWWRENRADDARNALGKAIEIAEAPVTTGTPLPNQTGPTFPNEQERAKKAVEEFQKVQRAYGSPYSDLARYFAAVNLVTVEREKGLKELEDLTRGGNDEVASRARFALAQAREADKQYDAAAALYQELLKEKGRTVSENIVNLRLASVYEKQGKKDEAAGILFQMVEAGRKAKDKDGKTVAESSAVRAAASKLQELSPERYAQLPPPPPPTGGLPF
jgi:tetratricopeptide (TPR) repeat protein